MPVKIPISLSQQDLLKGIDEQKKQWQEVEKAVRKLGGTADKEEQKRIAHAKRIIKSQRTEKDVLNDNIQALRTLGKTSTQAGAESREAIRQLITKYRDQRAAIEQLARKEEEATTFRNQSIAKGVDASRKLKEATGRISREYVKLKGDITTAFEAGEIGADDYHESLQKIEDAQQETFGEKAVGSLGKYFGAITVGAAVFESIQSRLERINELQRESLEAAKVAVPADVKLAGVFKEQLPEAIKRADSTAFELGLDRNATKELLFDAKSGGFLEEFETVARGGIALQSTEAAGIAAGKVRQAFPQLSPAEAINLSLKSSELSSLRPEEFTRSLPVATLAGRTIGASPEETFAIQSQLANLSKSGETSATSLNAFSRAADKAGLGGDGFFAAVDKFSAFDDERRKKELEANSEAFEAFKNLKLLQENIKGVERSLITARRNAGTPQSAVNQVLGPLEELPSFVAAKISQQTALESEFRNEKRVIEAANIEKLRRQVKDNTKFNLSDLPLTALDSTPIVGNAFKPTVSENAVEVGNAINGSAGGNVFRNFASLLGFEEGFSDDRMAGADPQLIQKTQEQTQAIERQTEEIRRQTEELKKQGKKPRDTVIGIE